MTRKQVQDGVAREQRSSTDAPVVRVTTLGGFSIRVHGEPLVLGRKAPAKPLALLKFLAGHGQHAVTDAMVAGALWPDKGRSAQRCLAVTLHRLRRLLGSAEALIHREQHVAIDSQLLWCDAVACEQLLDLAARCKRDAQRMQLTARALAIYGGEFLAGEPADGWIAPVRERLRARYVASCAALAEHFAAGARWDEARLLFQRGLEADELSENLCLGLMACYRAMRRPLAGRDAYQRFARALAARSGAEPAPALQALYQQLSHQHPARNAVRTRAA